MWRQEKVYVGVGYNWEKKCRRETRKRGNQGDESGVNLLTGLGTNCLHNDKYPTYDLNLFFSINGEKSDNSQSIDRSWLIISSLYQSIEDSLKSLHLSARSQHCQKINSFNHPDWYIWRVTKVSPRWGLVLMIEDKGKWWNISTGYQSDKISLALLFALLRWSGRWSFWVNKIGLCPSCDEVRELEFPLLY